MSDTLPPDLLREHRLDLGLPASPPPLRPARGLLLLGGGLGMVVMLAALLCISCFRPGNRRSSSRSSIRRSFRHSRW